MTKEQLDNILGEIQICELLEDMNLDEKKKEEEQKIEQNGQ